MLNFRANKNALNQIAPACRDFIHKYRFRVLALPVIVLWLDIQAVSEPLWHNAVLVGFSHVFVVLLAFFSIQAWQMAIQSGLRQDPSRTMDIPSSPSWKIQLIDSDNQNIKESSRKLTNGRLIVGRDLQCDICIPEKSVSRKHFKLVADNNSIYAIDLNSANGTYVNGEKLPSGQAKMLHPGDMVVPADLKQTSGLKITRE